MQSVADQDNYPWSVERSRGSTRKRTGEEKKQWMKVSTRKRTGEEERRSSGEET